MGGISLQGTQCAQPNAAHCTPVLGTLLYEHHVSSTHWLGVLVACPHSTAACTYVLHCRPTFPGFTTEVQQVGVDMPAGPRDPKRPMLPIWFLRLLATVNAARPPFLVVFTTVERVSPNEPPVIELMMFVAPPEARNLQQDLKEGLPVLR